METKSSAASSSFASSPNSTTPSSASSSLEKTKSKPTTKLETASFAKTGGAECSSSKADDAVAGNELRKLQKLLRQIHLLEADLNAQKTLNLDQLAKIGRKKEIEAQIASI